MSVISQNVSFTPPTNDFIITPLSADKPAGTSGVTAYTFTVTRAYDSSQPDSGSFTVAGTSTAPARGSDFEGGVLPSGIINFAAGQTSETITINVLGNPNPEPDEQFAVNLGGGHIVPNVPFDPAAVTATGTIRHSGAAVSTVFSIEANPPVIDFLNFYLGPDQNEGAPSVQGDFGIGFPASAGSAASYLFTIYRDGDLSQAETVDWVVSGSGANPATAADFIEGTFPSGTANFAPGQAFTTLQIDLQSDFTPEPDQGFVVTLSNASLGSVFDQASASAMILNDDIATQSGNTGNDTINLSAIANAVVIDASQGGNDKVTGGNFDDIFYFGAALTGADVVNGGSGNDTLVLDGNYSAGVTLTKTSLTGVENIYLTGGNSYKLTLDKTYPASGSTLYIDAKDLGEINTATINGAAVKGTLQFLGGAGNNVFTGGSGNDIFLGGSGTNTFNGGAGNDFFVGGEKADSLTGGKGSDTFFYGQWSYQVSESDIGLNNGAIDTSQADTLVGFETKSDKIDISEFFFGLIGKASVTTKATPGFTANVGTGVGFFGNSGVVVEYASAAKTTNARIYVDANANGNLDSDDMLIQATGVTRNGINGSNFVF